MLQEQIESELTTAIKSGDYNLRDTLRLLKSALKNFAIELHKEELTDGEVTTVIAREIKRRKESIEAYQVANKPKLAEAEKAELNLLQKYMPELMSEEDIKAHVAEYLEKNPTTMSEMGKAMGALSGELKGKADMGVVSRILREQLQ